MPERKKKNYSGRTLAQLLETGLITNKGTGGYLQLIQADRRGNDWLARDQPLDPDRRYEIVIPQFIMDGKEVNLEFLGDYPYENPATLKVNGEIIKNDIRAIVISYLAGR